MNQQELKLHCLNLAEMSARGKDQTTEEIIAAAVKFEAFVTSQDIQPQ